jgi:hypothetical protein
MKRSKTSAFLIAVIILAATLALQPDGFAKGHGQGRGHNKKSEKFINGHDASEGRWDGRGPKPAYHHYHRHHHRHGHRK